jgi:hypothetical protein
MAADIISSPAQDVWPVGQYLVYTIDDDADTPPDRFVVIVRRSTNPTTVGAEKAKLYLVPNASDVVHFDLSKIARGILEFPLSKDGVAIHAVQDAAKVFNCDELCLLRFTIQAASYTGTTESAVQDTKAIFLLNGTEQISSGLLPSFSDYYPTAISKKGWLTDLPLVNDQIVLEMGDEDEAVAMFVNTNSLGVATTMDSISLAGYNAAGTFLETQSISVADATTNTKNNLYALPIGPAAWSHLGFTDAVVEIEVFLNQTGVARMSRSIIVKNNKPRPCKHEATQLAWINTRGGWDYLRFDSRAPLTISTTGKEYRKNVGTYGEATFTIASNIQQYDTYGKVGKESYTLSEQFFTEAQRDLCQYLMRSPVVQMRRGTGDWEPCIVRTNSLQIQPAGSQFYEVSLDVELARDIRC